MTLGQGRASSTSSARASSRVCTCQVHCGWGADSGSRPRPALPLTWLGSKKARVTQHPSLKEANHTPGRSFLFFMRWKNVRSWWWLDSLLSHAGLRVEVLVKLCIALPGIGSGGGWAAACTPSSGPPGRTCPSVSLPRSEHLRQVYAGQVCLCACHKLRSSGTKQPLVLQSSPPRCILTLAACYQQGPIPLSSMGRQGDWPLPSLFIPSHPGGSRSQGQGSGHADHGWTLP